MSLSPGLSLRLLGHKDLLISSQRKIESFSCKASRTKVEILMGKGKTLGINNKSGSHASSLRREILRNGKGRGKEEFEI